MDSGERLTRDLASPEFQAGAEQGFWELAGRKGDMVHVRLNAPDGRVFLARFDCTGYWNEPISCSFIPCGSPQVWPDGDVTFEGTIKFRSSPGFICWDQDRQGIYHHPEWRQSQAWQKKENQIVGYLDFLRTMLHVPARGYTRKS